MLRQRVLEQWKDFKKKYLLEKDLLEKLSNGLSYMTFGYSTTGLVIKENPYQVLEEIKNKLPSIVQDCQKLRDEYTSNKFGEEQSMPLWFTYTSYIGLVETYKKIIEYYDQDQSGPTIEEVE